MFLGALKLRSNVSKARNFKLEGSQLGAAVASHQVEDDQVGIAHRACNEPSATRKLSTVPKQNLITAGCSLILFYFWEYVFVLTTVSRIIDDTLYWHC